MSVQAVQGGEAAVLHAGGMSVLHEMLENINTNVAILRDLPTQLDINDAPPTVSSNVPSLLENGKPDHLQTIPAAIPYPSTPSAPTGLYCRPAPYHDS